MKINIRNKNFYFILAIFLIGIISIFFIFDGINAIKHQIITYDEAYNATVAANVMRYGEYRVSYPNYTIFDNMITSGITVILPTALLYKFFGINNITSNIVALIYGVLCIWCVWKLLNKSIKGNGTIERLISSILTILLLLSESLFAYVSTHLIGEVAALFFLLASFIFMIDYTVKKTKITFFLSGFMLASAFLTKSSAIFFVVCCFGMVIIEGFINKRFYIKHMVLYYVGFFAGFIAIDSYKVIQLGGFYNYLKWWFHEWKNMLSQSSGVDIAYSLNKKIEYLEVIFSGCNKFFCIFIILLPCILYLLSLFYSIIKKEKLFTNEIHVIIMAGVAGASLLIYFILLGGTGLVYARRHLLNAFFIRFFCAVLLGKLLLKVVENGKRSLKNGVLTLAYLLTTLIGGTLLFQSNVIIKNLDNYIDKEKENTYELQLMNQYLNEVKALPNDATLYCAGWWQEPTVTLFLDRDMKDIYEVVNGEGQLEDNSYFLVGNYILDESISHLEEILNIRLKKVDKIRIDYYRYSSAFDRQDFDNFAIYKIIKYPLD